MTPWILQALNGLSMGALLFLLASGFTLTFGLVRLVNLAHGGFYLLGGYLGLSVLRLTGNFWLGLLAGGVGIVIVSWATDRFLIRRTRDNVLGQVLLTVGVAYVIADVCLLTWGGNPLRIPQPEFARGPIDLPGGLVYPRYRFLLIVFGAVIALALGLLYHRTQLGAIIRAGVDDREMVNAVGVNIDRLFALVFGLAAFLAGLSGVAGGAFLTLYPGAEWEILAYALVVVIVGGLGSLRGAFLAALLVGLLDTFGRILFPEFAQFAIFAPMALTLVVRPAGLLGRR